MAQSDFPKVKKILILGATGYVGGRLVPRLLKDGFCVRAAGRSLNKLKSRPWAHEASLELVAVDVLERSSLEEAMKGIAIIYYFVHSMNRDNHDFVNTDRQAAQNLIDCASRLGVERIIYLGGLGEDRGSLSHHLRSRQEVGKILASGDVPVTVLRAAMIIGSGSASFEILRYLVDRLPVMVTPKWVRTRNQPIAIRNVIEYLVRCLNVAATTGETFDIGGPDVLTYHDLMETYAREAHLPKRFVVPVPVLTPRLSSLWIHFVTPVPDVIARPLTEGLCNEVICRENKIRDLIPQDLLSCSQAIRYALRLASANDVKTYWADAGQIPPYAMTLEGDPDWAGGTLLKDHRCHSVKISKEKLWHAISRIGGQTGWYHGDWLWALRGQMDRWVGGVGLRRGRRDPVQLADGDALDFWRVVHVKPCQSLLLVAEMKLPGRATLEFKIDSADNDEVILHQIALFRPKGLLGILYWYLISPLHEYIFGGMIRKIIDKARYLTDS